MDVDPGYDRRPVVIQTKDQVVAVGREPGMLGIGRRISDLSDIATYKIIKLNCITIAATVCFEGNCSAVRGARWCAPLMQRIKLINGRVCW